MTSITHHNPCHTRISQRNERSIQYLRPKSSVISRLPMRPPHSRCSSSSYRIPYHSSISTLLPPPDRRSPYTFSFYDSFYHCRFCVVHCAAVQSGVEVVDNGGGRGWWMLLIPCYLIPFVTLYLSLVTETFFSFLIYRCITYPLEYLYSHYFCTYRFRYWVLIYVHLSFSFFLSCFLLLVCVFL
jgi:hypothetical protein